MLTENYAFFLCIYSIFYYFKIVIIKKQKLKTLLNTNNYKNFEEKN